MTVESFKFRKTAQWLRVAAAHHFDDAVRGVRVDRITHYHRMLRILIGACTRTWYLENVRNPIFASLRR